MNATEAPRGNTPGPLSFWRKSKPMAQPRRRSASTPLELVAVAIVTGIVATMPDGVYRPHRVRGEVSGVVELAAPIAPLIVDSTRRGDDVPAELSAAISQAFQETPTTSVVESVAVVDGRIDIVFGNGADGAI